MKVILFGLFCLIAFLCYNITTPTINQFDRNKTANNFRQLSCVGGQAKKYSYLINKLNCKKYSYNKFNCDLDTIVLPNNQTIVLTNKQVLCNKYNNCNMFYELEYLNNHIQLTTYHAIIMPFVLVIGCLLYEYYKITKARKEQIICYHR